MGHPPSGCGSPTVDGHAGKEPNSAPRHAQHGVARRLAVAAGAAAKQAGSGAGELEGTEDPFRWLRRVPAYVQRGSPRAQQLCSHGLVPSRGRRAVAASVAALTHGAPAAQAAAATGARLLARALRADAVDNVLEQAPTADGPRGTAQHALHHAVATVRAHPAPELYLEALSVADRAGGRGACTYTGALLGALHGSAALPQDRLAALEAGRVGYILAGDCLADDAERSHHEQTGTAASSWLWPYYPRTY
jgi:hypothetical protein